MIPTDDAFLVPRRIVRRSSYKRRQASSGSRISASRRSSLKDGSGLACLCGLCLPLASLPLSGGVQGKDPPPGPKASGWALSALVAWAGFAVAP